DDQVVANDVVIIINWINAHPGQSEGESTADLTTAASDMSIVADTALMELTDNASVHLTTNAAKEATTMRAPRSTISNDLINLLAADAASAVVKRRRMTSNGSFE